MPDLNTALRTALENGKRLSLSKTLNDWEKDEKQTQLEKPVQNQSTDTADNVTRATFDYVQKHPYSTQEQVKNALHQFKSSSVGSLLAQFVFQEQMTCDSYGRYKVIVKQYKPLKSRAAWAKQKGIKLERQRAPRKVVVVKRRTEKDVEKARAAEGIATLTLPVVAKPWRPEETVDQLTLGQAKAVYEYLKQIFGG
jgi:hypothetical protein